MPLPAGTRLGAYEILAPLGAGGMGEVYRAHDAKLNRDVALKVLPTSVAADPERLARFRREAQVLASLNHPNIGHIYGFEDSGATHALVLELIDGPTLADLISRPGDVSPSASGNAARPAGRSRLPLEQVLSIARQIADALEAAHEQGIIHRDLKPANVKVRDDGTVKVLDFGLAKALSPEGSGAPADAMNSPTLTGATQLGVILGTAAYMAPEQAKGKSVDRRADIWAFGVVLYEMLAGRRGYEAEDISETLAAVLTREVEWTALPAGTPPRLLTLLRDCLVRDPKQRLRDIGDARRVLEQITTGTLDSAAPAVTAAGASASRVPAWRRALPWTIAAAAVLVAGIATWFALRTPPVPLRTVTRSTIELKDFSGFIAVSRDGTKLAYNIDSPQGFLLALRQMDQFDGRPLAGVENGVGPLFSPAGDWIAYTQQGSTPKLRKVPLGGGTSTALCDGSFLDGAAWGDDDTIVFSGANGLLRVSANGGTPVALTTLDKSKGESAHAEPQFLPGGRQLLFTLRSTAPDSPQFAVLDLRTGRYRTVAKGGNRGRYVPTGHLTYGRNDALYAVPFDLARLAVTGAETPVIESVSSEGPPNTADYAFSQTGVLVYSKAMEEGRATILEWADRQGTVQSIPGLVPRNWGAGRLSPDGRRVANNIQAEKDSDIWVMDLSRSVPTRLTFGGLNNGAIWTPDGRRVMYHGSKDDRHGIYSVPADGSGPPVLMIPTSSSALPTSITPDGRALLYTQDHRVQVLPLSRDGTAGQPRPFRETTAPEGEAQVSPDGQWVALTSAETNASEVYVLPFPGPGPKTRISTDGGRAPRWAHSGRELFYWSTVAGSTLMRVTIQPTPAFQASVPTPLFRFLAGTTWDVAPDGEHFLLETNRASGTGSIFVTVTDWFDELRRRAPAK